MSKSSCITLSLAVALGGAASLAWVTSAPAADPKPKTVEQIVREALHGEIYGYADSDKLLQQAREMAPDYGPAQWHTGHVRYQNKWVSADEVPSLADKDLKLKEYNKYRDNYPKTAEGQLSLADWCAKKGLPEQERAHLTNVLALSPDQADARARLGYRRANNDWVLEDNGRQDQARQAAVANSLKEWTGKLDQIRDGLTSRSLLQKEAATKKLKAIDDASAVPALESVFADADQESLLLVVATLGNIQDQQASMALARLATASNFEAVRTAAVDQLKKRPFESYMPAMLSTMYTPAEVKSELYRGKGGSLLFRQSFVREGQDSKEVVVMETNYRRNALPGGNASETTARALNHASSTAANRELALQQQNSATDALNDRIGEVLRTVTGYTTAAGPEDWWAWWNQYNDLYVSGDKTVHETTLRQTIVLQDQVATMSLGPQQLDCLAKGTTVWTLSGAMPIEQVKIGDMVLSQNPDTGELTYKPVLGTTIRPAGQLIAIDTGDEQIQTSGGHLFWMTGAGWVKARDIKSGYELHTTKGTQRVSALETGRSEPTYNLVVADFHTYFAGYSKVLCHDNTLRQPTQAIVPGLVEK